MSNGTSRTMAELRTRPRAPGPARGRGGCAGCGAPAGGKCSCSDACVPCGCGKLACLCRPNWFAGMVLRDEDLRRLDTYIIERFRRVNLQFFGPGVVNGLEVRCDPCGSGVVVGCGHAISPCGDDIVVCDDAYVDVCDLINRCRQKERDACLPHQRPRDCPDLTEQWVLAIEYTERPERGILPLRREPAGTSCGCGCGGSGGCGGGCGCGCGGGSTGCGCDHGHSGWSGASAPGKTHADRPRHAPPSCEPTLLCEDFRFRVCPPPELPPACRTGRQDNTRPERGAMLDRMACCVNALMENLPAPPAFDSNNPDQDILAREGEWYRWFCLIKKHLLDFVSRYPAANCEAVSDLQRLAILRLGDFADSQAYLAWWRETIELVALILIELLFSCICSGLLPPCPETATSTAVPIATVTVSHAGGSCRVVSVCNWTRLRRYSSNLRTLEYWFSWIPVGRDLRRLMECLCCDLLGGLFVDDERRRRDTPGPAGIAPHTHFRATGPSPDGASPAGNGEGASGTARIRERLNRRLRPEAVGFEFDRLAATARSVMRTSGPAEPNDVFADLFGRGRPGAGPFGSAATEAPAEALLLNSLAAPILRGIATSPGLRNFGFDLGNGEGSLAAGPAARGSVSADEMEAMRGEIAALRTRLDELDRRG